MFKDHLLTRVLRASMIPCQPLVLDGKRGTYVDAEPTSIMMVCCVATSACWFKTTSNTLKFAARCMKVKSASRGDKKKAATDKATMQQYRALIKEIQELKKEVQIHTLERADMLANEETALEDTSEEWEAWNAKAKALDAALKATSKESERVIKENKAKAKAARILSKELRQ